MVSGSRAWAWLIATAGLAMVAESSLAATTARADRTTLNVNESFQVFFQTDQEVSGRPDLTPLERDFEVLGTSQSTSINMVNGQVQRAATWVVDLMPRRAGRLVVPAISIGGERSNVIEIDVRPAATGGAAPSGDILLEAVVDNPAPYVQGQFILTIRLLRSVPIGNASLTEPRVTGGDVVVEKLGDDAAYETDRGGVRMAVIERRYALFAQNSGSLVVEPMLFEGRVAEDRRFGFDPFARGRVVRARTDPIDIQVQPIPPGFSGGVWLPAEQLMLVEKAPDGQGGYRVGEPFTRTLTLQATGLTSSQLPEIEAPVPPDIKQYPDQPELENRVASGGVVGIRQQKVALIPSAAGEATLPAIAIPWWDTRADRLEYARLPARTIEVLPAAGAPADTQAPAPAAATDGAAPVATARTDSPAAGAYWPWLCLALAVGWAATVLGWLRSRHRATSRAVAERTRLSESSLVKSIKAACDANDAETVKNELLRWASLHWPGDNVRSLGGLAARLDGDLQAQIHGLSRHLYRRDEMMWDAASFWRAFDERRREKSARSRKPVAELQPLYL